MFLIMNTALCFIRIEPRKELKATASANRVE